MHDVPIAVRDALVELGQLVSAERRARGFTQSELADRVGVGRLTISRLERGAPGVAVGTALTAAWVLGLPVLRFADFTAARHRSVVGAFLEQLDDRLPRQVHPPREEADDDF